MKKTIRSIFASVSLISVIACGASSQSKSTISNSQIGDDLLVEVGEYSAHIRIHNDKARKIFNFLLKNSKLNSKSYWIENVVQVKANNNYICGRKLTKKFDQDEDELPIYVCKSASNPQKLIGGKAKKLFDEFEENIAHTHINITGKNIGCAQSTTSSEEVLYSCGITVFPEGDSEGSAQFVLF